MKHNDNAPIYIFLAILTLAVLAGFYVVFRQLNAIQQVVLNAPSLTGQNAVAAPSSTAAGTSTAPSSTTTTPPAASGTVSIPTSIIFSTLSSPALQPQANITVTIESVTVASDGTVTVNLKAFTDQATSYSSLGLSSILQVVNLSSGNESPVSTTGNWSSMPPGGSTTGTAVFKIDPSVTSFILQVGPAATANYYQFNLATQSYKETALG